jgi:hypothetical protein
VPDEVCKGLDRLAAYEYRPPALDDEVAAGTAPKLIDAEILGHIFEQSIGDLEQLRQEIAKGRAGEGGPVGAEEGPASRRQDELTPISPTNVHYSGPCGRLFAETAMNVMPAPNPDGKDCNRAPEPPQQPRLLYRLR